MRSRPYLFAALAAIGAFFIAHTAGTGIGLELWTSGRLLFPAGPPRFEPALALGALAGTFVGWRLGRWRGLLGVIAYGLFGFLLTLRYPITLRARREPRCVGRLLAL